MTKVLFLTYHLPLPHESGAFRPLMEARLMRDLGYSVTVITAGTHYMTGTSTQKKRGLFSQEEWKGIPIIKTFAPAGHRKSVSRRTLNYLTFSFFALMRGLRERRIGRIFVGTDPIFIMPVAYILSVVKRCPLILDERDLYPETAIALGVLKEGLLSKILEKMQAFFRKKAKNIIVATPGIYQVLHEKGVPKEKLLLMHNADVFLKEDLENIDESKIPDYRTLTGKEFLILYTGGMGMANDILTILKAANFLQDQYPKIGFVLIGGGERRYFYEEYCQKEGINNAYFFDALPRWQIRLTIKNNADLCIQALKNHKHFRATLTSKVLDYLAIGKPVIFSGGGDIDELLKNANGGVCVPPESPHKLSEAITQLYKDRNSLEPMGKNAQKYFYKHFTKKRYMDIMRDALE